jgi:hypothetical protein
MLLSWVIAAIVCAVAVWKGPVVLRPARDLLLPMWLPLVVMIVAAFVLFATDQGQDLGIGLLDNDQFLDGQLVLLALALLYWATGSWHAARLGLNRAFGTDKEKWPKGYEPWLRWLPRVLGAGAHFFASLSLALAARHAVKPDAEIVLPVPLWPIELPLWPIVFVPPTVIAIGTFVLWLHDRPYAAAQRRYARARSLYEAPAKQQGAERDYKKARRHLYGVVLGLVAAAIMIAVLLWTLRDRLPVGLVPATCWILLSAVLFLLVVSHRRRIGDLIVKYIPTPVAERLNNAFNEIDERGARSSTVLAGFLTLVALIVGVWTWHDPVSLGRTAGSMVVGFFAFGAYIAVIDLVRILCGTDPRSGARFAAFCSFLLLLATITSATRDFHRVRLCGDPRTPCASATPDGSAADGKVEPWADDRPTVAEAARAWYTQAATAWPKGEPVPMLIVATAGGGIRAAYWTATILERLERDLGPDLVRRHLFAISGVSGGSVGAAAYAAAIAASPGDAARPTDYLDDDFLAPAVAATAFIDGPSNFLPELGQGDRGYALERAWEEASAEELLAHPFLSFFPSRQELDRAASWRPALFLNATHQDTGRRVITGHLKVERHIFLDSFDAHALLNADMPASTAAHNSARFTYISPAGKLVPRRPSDGRAQALGFLLDGGYFENFGALTALQLVREARRAIGEDKPLRPVILQISSDPSLTSRDRPRLDQDISLCDGTDQASFLSFQRGEWQGLRWNQRDGGGWVSSFLNEVTAPIAGILASRGAHGTLASQELAYAICTERRSPMTASPKALDNLLSGTKSPPVLNVGGASGDGKVLPQVDQRPEFAHLAMCDDEKGAIVPPLGWALSDFIRGQFPTILNQCGNPEELNRLIAALRMST